MTTEQRTASERIERVVMALIASTSDEARGLRSAKAADEVSRAALAIAIDAANAQIEILAIINDMNNGAVAF